MMSNSSHQTVRLQRTFLFTAHFIRAIILTVVEVVAEQVGADAATIGALELVLLAYWLQRMCC